jgi:hypothetical protein
MKTVILKPVMWNTKSYEFPSGYPSKSGFARDYGYGHEEWNNNPTRLWGNYRIFVTQAKVYIRKFAKNGNLGIIFTASFKGKQYALGIATKVSEIVEDERKRIVSDLGIFDAWREVWDLDIVKRKFDPDNYTEDQIRRLEEKNRDLFELLKGPFKNNRYRFMAHWKRNYMYLDWKCPRDQFYWFTHPILLNPKGISGKKRICTMHDRYQIIDHGIAKKIIENEMPEGHNIIGWLTEGTFNENFQIQPKGSPIRKPRFSPEFDGTIESYRSKNLEEYERFHGKVVNKLAEYLYDHFDREIGKIYNTREIDLGIKINNEKEPSYLFEIKSSTDSQSIYTGIGQLIVHSRNNPSTNKYLVIPNEGLSDSFCETITALKIKLIKYSIQGKDVIFHNRYDLPTIL